jgi:5-methylcytosine-specific restriction endonuclease McrA
MTISRGWPDNLNLPKPQGPGVPGTGWGKATVWKLLGPKCFYCPTILTKESVTFDHVVPRHQGGKWNYNVVPCCLPCNQAKGGRTPTDEQRKLCREAWATAKVAQHPLTDKTDIPCSSWVY